MAMNDDELALKYKAEDTDAQEEQDKDAPQKANLTSMLLRISGGVVFVVAIGLIIYGFVFVQPDHAKVVRMKELKRERLALLTPTSKLTMKPRDELRSFEFATLKNGVQAVTVQDTRALQKGFAAAVQAGSFDEPANLPGLAHFCEHMVFLGTSKFKEPSGFDNFLAAHGGESNAFTAEEATVYYASVSQDAAAEGLVRFADIFRAPLFSEKYVAKEVHAIDSEHSKNVQNSYRQVRAVLYSLALEASPISGFHTGNIETLVTDPSNAQPPVDPVQALKVFWETHYCPDRIKVVTVGSESNAAQLKLIEKEFGTLKPQSRACEAQRPKFDVPNPYPPEQLQKWVNVQGMLPTSFMWLQFPLPDVGSEYASAPLDYIEYVLEYSGENSLSRVLKDSMNLAIGVDVMFDTSTVGTQLFLIIQLTQQGRENSQLVLDIIFAYLAVLNRDGVHDDLYNSLAAVRKLKWDWGGQKGVADTSKILAERLTRVKPKDLLWADSLIARTDRHLVQSLLAKLVPSNMNVAFVRGSSKDSSESDAFFKGQQVKGLPHYPGLNYTVQSSNDVFEVGSVSKWTKWLHGEVTATSIEKSIAGAILTRHIEVIPHTVPVPKPPRRIVGIPRSLAVDHMHAKYSPFSDKVAIDTLLYGPKPERIQLLPSHQDATGKAGPLATPEIWYRAGWMQASPKVQLSLSLLPVRSPNEPELGPLQEVQLELYGRLLTEEMNPKLVDLTAPGMSYSIGLGVGGGGIHFDFLGFEPSMHTLITTVMSEFNAFNNDPSLTPPVRWGRVLNQLREDLTTYSDLPLNYAVSDRNLLLTKGGHSRSELVEVLNNHDVSLEKSSTSVSDLLLSKPMQLTALAMGNMDKDETHSMIGDFVRAIDHPGSPGLEEKQHADVERIRPVVNLNSPVEVRKLNPRAGDTNNVVVVSVVSGVSTVESRVLLGLLSALYRAMAYNDLRTESQMGYVVSASVVLLSNVHLMSCVVQGNRFDADAMEAAVHHLNLDSMPKRLNDMTDKEFNAYKSSFRQDLLQPPTTLKNEFDNFKGPVNQGGIGFDLLNEMLRFLDGPGATKESLKAEWQKLMFPKRGQRNAAIVKYFANKHSLSPRTLEQANKTWMEHNVSQSARTLLAREFVATKHLSEVGSAERNKLAKDGGWFPTDQHLKLMDDKSATQEPIHVPKQLIDLAKARKKEIETFVSTPIEYGSKPASRRIGSKLQNHLRSSLLAAGV